MIAGKVEVRPRVRVTRGGIGVSRAGMLPRAGRQLRTDGDGCDGGGYGAWQKGDDGGGEEEGPLDQAG